MSSGRFGARSSIYRNKIYRRVRRSLWNTKSNEEEEEEEEEEEGKEEKRRSGRRRRRKRRRNQSTSRCGKRTLRWVIKARKYGVNSLMCATMGSRLANIS